MKTANRRDDVLRIATELIKRNGYRATSVDDVIKASGVSRATIYYHFSSKEALGFAVLEQEFCQFLGAIRKEAERGATPADKVDLVFDTLERKHRQSGMQQGCLFGNLVCELASSHEGFQMRLGRLFNDLQSFCAELLSPWRSKLGGVTPESLAEFVVAAMEGSLLLGKANRNGDVVSRCRLHTVRYLKSCVSEHSNRSPMPE